MRMARWGGWVGLTTTLLLLMAVGCGDSGPPRATVQGRVTFDGVPIESGSIAFIPAQGTKGPSVGGSIRGGSYHLPSKDGPVVGPHRVEIRATRKTGRQVQAGSEAANPSATIDEIEMFIPLKYNSESTLTADVQSGTNTFDFELRAAPGADPAPRRAPVPDLP